MKKINFFLLLLTTFQIAIAQTITVTGAVKNEKGIALPFALVQDKQDKSTTYTDSIGAFSLRADAYSILLISCKGYKDAAVKVDKNKSLQVVLKEGGPNQSNTTNNSSNINNSIDDAITGHTNFSPAYNTSNATQGGEAKFNGASFPIRREKEETKGTRYLFNNWVKGSVIDSNNLEIKNQAYLFNYDKLGGGLILTNDQKSAIVVDKEQIKSFTLYDQSNEPFVFEMVSAIDNLHFFQVLSAGSKYKIYKLTKTKFIKSDYSTNGLITTGNSYDEFVDENIYYVLTIQNNQVKKLTLKKKSIKEAFEIEENKLNTFFTNHSADLIDEHFLKILGDYINS